MTQEQHADVKQDMSIRDFSKFDIIVNSNNWCQEWQATVNCLE